MSNFNATPASSRIHIGFFGKRNSGKSSLINKFCNQEVSIVSSTLGTTTDSVSKVMEIHGIGPCVIIDSAGVDDEGELGEKRVEKTKQALKRCDIAILLFNDLNIEIELDYYNLLKRNNTKVIPVISKSDLKVNEELIEKIRNIIKIDPIILNVYDDSIKLLKNKILEIMPEDFNSKSITLDLINKDDLVLLVMPQDKEAPKNRLILPQVQTIRDLIDNKCSIVVCDDNTFISTLNKLKDDPNLIITDSQVFKYVYEHKPANSKLTSFSVLFAKLKGDIDYYVNSIKQLDNLGNDAHILIAEACTHSPISEDIGTVKIPILLRKRLGDKITIEHVAGRDFPDDLSKYDLIIHCGACMFNYKYVMNRINQAKSQNVLMSNYGIVIAYLNNILDKIVY